MKKNYRVIFSTLNVHDLSTICNYGSSDYMFYITAKLAQVFWTLSFIPGQKKYSTLEEIIHR